MNNNKGNIRNYLRIGNFTKNAVKTFEKNIVSQINYLEKIKSNKDKK